MTLTVLRRLVAAGAVLALVGAGGAAWFALQAEASARPPDTWTKAFPAEKKGSADLANQGPGPNKEYLDVLWVQGEKPKKENPNEAKVEAPKVDPFQFRLLSIWATARREDGLAQIQPTAPPNAPALSVPVGLRVPDPAAGDGKALLPWKLEEIRLPTEKDPAMAIFRNLDTDEERTLSAEPYKPGLQATLPGAEGERKIDGVMGGREGVPPPDQQARFIRISEDKAKGTAEYQTPDEEVWFLENHSDKEVSKISTVPATGSQGGFVIKGLAADSHAKAAGFKAEDRVISVNGERVASPEQAVSTGKRQYEGGTSTFVVKIDRAGKEMNFTFHAPKKKDGKK